MVPQELTPQLAAAALDGAALAYFDGRLTEAAAVLAGEAAARGVPVLVEGERLRPGLEALLGQADYVVCSAHFPQAWTGEACLGDALLATLRCARLLWGLRGGGRSKSCTFQAGRVLGVSRGAPPRSCHTRLACWQPLVRCHVATDAAVTLSCALPLLLCRSAAGCLERAG
jgi:hypothetical protein